MEQSEKKLSITYKDLIIPTYQALIALGGAGTNDEIRDNVIKIMELPDDVVEILHLGNMNKTEIEYQLAWARTYLKNYGVIKRNARSFWSLTSDYRDGTTNILAEEVINNKEKMSDRRKGTKSK